MKKMFKVISTGLMVCAIALGTTLATNQTKAHAEANNNAGGKISVNGQGSIKVKPDIAYVDAGVQTEDADAKKAQSQNAEKMNAVIAAIKAMGIAEDDIKTSGYYMYPQYDYSQNGKSTIVGYTVSNTVTITVKDIDKVGEIIDKVGDAGANVVNTVRFSLSDSAKYYEQALALAVKNAESKGKALAQAIGVKISTPAEVIENGGNYAPVAYESAVARDTMAGSNTSISTGELDVSCNITVIYGY